LNLVYMERAKPGSLDLLNYHPALSDFIRID
jgi:hypothetical protein